MLPVPAARSAEVGYGFRYSGDKANENDLKLTNDLSAISSDTVFFGSLGTLLEWHIADPVDAAERIRNDLVY